MLIFSTQTLIKAHADKRNPYYNHSYPRYVRDAECSNCGMLIGEQVKYPDFDKEFKFEATEKNGYKFCPYCGKELETHA